jgi:hypothetical protein
MHINHPANNHLCRNLLETVVKMKLSTFGFLALVTPSPAWSFVTPSQRMASTSKLFMAEGDEGGPVMNKYSRYVQLNP